MTESELTHPTAWVETDDIGVGTRIWAWTHVCAGTVIGAGCIIGEGVYIGPGVRIGSRCKIANHAILYEGVEIEDDVFIGPNCVTTNDALPRAVGDWRHRFQRTLIKRGASVAANCTIVCGHVLGEGCMVGAGSVVTQDIRPGWIAYGNPARHVRRRDDL